MRKWLFALAVTLTFAARFGGAAPVGTAFTYQGRLTEAGGPANGTYDFQLILYDAPAGGSQVGPIVIGDDVVVTSGLFTVSLDFGAVFTGSQRWLEMGVRPGATTGAFSILSPRQELTPTPHALYAADATTVAGLTCLDGQVAKWSGSAWTCGADNDTAPTASAPISVISNNIALSTCPADLLYKMNGSGTAWVCASDIDTNTTQALAPWVLVDRLVRGAQHLGKPVSRPRDSRRRDTRAGRRAC